MKYLAQVSISSLAKVHFVFHRNVFNSIPIAIANYLYAICCIGIGIGMGK
jgi:hypothetical protein